MRKGNVIDEQTKDYLLEKMEELRKKVARAKKFKKKHDWKEFRANINKRENERDE